MADFKDLDEYYKHLKENPLEDMIGQDMKIECPICKTETIARVISSTQIKCNKCNEEINADVE